MKNLPVAIAFILLIALVMPVMANYKGDPNDNAGKAPAVAEYSSSLAYSRCGWPGYDLYGFSEVGKCIAEGTIDGTDVAARGKELPRPRSF